MYMNTQMKAKKAYGYGVFCFTRILNKKNMKTKQVIVMGPLA